MAAAISGLLATSAVQAGAESYLDPATGNTSAVANWRFSPGQVFNGVAGALDGVALLQFTAASDGLNYVCSGSLLAGGQYVLTAGHCADDLVAGSMTVSFGVVGGTAAVSRSVSAVTLHPLWQGFDLSADRGTDLAILQLSTPVTTIAGYRLSGTVDIGKNYLMAGYGTTSVGSSNTATSWADWGYGHYAYNTFDVTSDTFNKAVQSIDSTWGYDAAYYQGITYMSDFDNPNGAARNNTLQRVANVTGNTFSSNSGLGTLEGLIAGGDSGGGDFVFDAATGTWVLSAVHSWGWQGSSVCSYINVGTNNCDVSSTNSSSYGDTSGSTAVYSSLAWIESVTGVTPVPEPGTWALMLGGMAAVSGWARRRAAR